MTVADEIRDHARIVVPLPMAGKSIVVRPALVRDMLEGGLASRILKFKEDSDGAEQDAAEILAEAKRALCICSCEPRVVEHETIHPMELCIKDLEKDDILFAFQFIVQEDDSRFFGVNRTAYSMLDIDALDRLMDKQMSIAYEIDLICRRWHISPKEVQRWTHAEFTRAKAIIEGAEHTLKKMKAKEAKKAKKKAK